MWPVAQAIADVSAEVGADRRFAFSFPNKDGRLQRQFRRIIKKYRGGKILFFGDRINA
jgi:hypothetical protein